VHVPVLSQSLGSEGGLVDTEGDSGDVATVVLSGEGDEGSPSASNVEQLVGRLEVELLAHELELVVLQLLERLRVLDVLHDSRGVDHSGSKEPEGGETSKISDSDATLQAN
jgi:hypothetical protein